MAVLSFAPVQFISSIPPATRAFTAATVVFTALYYFLVFTGNEGFAAPYLVLIPGSSLFYPWVFLTSAFVETSIVEVRSYKGIAFGPNSRRHSSYSLSSSSLPP